MSIDELTAALNRECQSLRAENLRLRSALSEIEDFARVCQALVNDIIHLSGD